MFRTIALMTSVSLLMLVAPQTASALDTDAHARSDNAQADRSDNSGPEIPYGGRDLAYDYVTEEYYIYTGPEPKDRRAAEQDGYRTGILHSPRAAYRTYSRYGYSGCGCAAYVSHRSHGYRQIDERRAPY